MDEINEGTTPEWEFDIVDGNGDPLAYTSLTTFEATLYDKETGAIINDRHHQDVLNDHGFTLDGDGHGKWKVAAADSVVLHPGADFEVHVLLLEWTYSAGAKNGKYEYVHRINNLGQTPSTSP